MKFLRAGVRTPTSQLVSAAILLLKRMRRGIKFNTVEAYPSTHSHRVWSDRVSVAQAGNYTGTVLYLPKLGIGDRNKVLLKNFLFPVYFYIPPCKLGGRLSFHNLATSVDKRKCSRLHSKRHQEGKEAHHSVRDRCNLEVKSSSRRYILAYCIIFIDTLPYLSF